MLFHGITRDSSTRGVFGTWAGVKGPLLCEQKDRKILRGKKEEPDAMRDRMS